MSYICLTSDSVNTLLHIREFVEHAIPITPRARIITDGWASRSW